MSKLGRLGNMFPLSAVITEYLRLSNLQRKSLFCIYEPGKCKVKRLAPNRGFLIVSGRQKGKRRPSFGTNTLLRKVREGQAFVRTPFSERYEHPSHSEGGHSPLRHSKTIQTLCVIITTTFSYAIRILI